MTKTLSYFRIPKQNFSKIVNNDEDLDLAEDSKDYINLEDTFMGLLYILQKTSPKKKIINKLFTPQNMIEEKNSFEESEFISIDEEEQLEKLKDFVPIPYFSLKEIEDINNTLNEINFSQVLKSYNANEMNELKIYPSTWQDDNKIHLENDFIKVKKLFLEAHKQQDYIVMLLG